MSRRWRLVLASVAFVGWLSYLGYAALTKNRGPAVSRVQAAAANLAIVAEVNAGPDGKPLPQVKIVEVLRGVGPAAGTKIEIANLPAPPSFKGEGKYLLLLNPEPHWRGSQDEASRTPVFSIVGQQRSPGNDLSGVGPPLIYPWTDDVRQQYDNLPRQP